MAGVAQHVHQEQAVLGAGVARAEHHAGARGAVDVRHAVAVVALDRHVGARADARGEVAFLDAERRVLEVVADLLVGQRRRAVQQVRVQRQLVGVVRRVCSGELEFGELLRVVEPVLAGGQDVAKAAGVVGAVGLDGRRRRRGRPPSRRARPRKRQQRDDGHRRRDDTPAAPANSSATAAAVAHVCVSRARCPSQPRFPSPACRHAVRVTQTYTL